MTSDSQPGRPFSDRTPEQERFAEFQRAENAEAEIARLRARIRRLEDAIGWDATASPALRAVLEEDHA